MNLPEKCFETSDMEKFYRFQQRMKSISKWIVHCFYSLECVGWHKHALYCHNIRSGHVDIRIRHQILAFEAMRERREIDFRQRVINYHCFVFLITIWHTKKTTTHRKDKCRTQIQHAIDKPYGLVSIVIPHKIAH